MKSQTRRNAIHLHSHFINESLVILAYLSKVRDTLVNKSSAIIQKPEEFHTLALGRGSMFVLEVFQEESE